MKKMTKKPKKVKNKFKKLKRSRLWPSVVLFVLSLVVGCGLLAAEFFIFTSYVVESKYTRSLSEVWSIARNVDAQLEAGDGMEEAVRQAAAQEGGTRPLAVIDGGNKILASQGEITADLSQPAVFEMLGEQEVFWDRSDAEQQIWKDRRRKDEVDRLDAMDAIVAMLTAQIKTPHKTHEMIGALSPDSITDTVMGCAFWQAVPLDRSGYRALVLSGITVQKDDLLFGIAITAVSGIMYLLIVTIMFCSVIAKAANNRRMEKLLMTDSVTDGDNWFAFTQKTARILRRRGNAGRAYAVADLSMAKYRGYCALHGTRAGEELLVKLDGLLRAALHKKELCARVNGADFALLLNAEPGEFGRQQTLARLDVMMASLSRDTPELSGMSFRVGFCPLEPCGVKERRGLDVEQLYTNAGIAKASIPRREGSRVACFSREMWEERLWEHKVEESMQAALDNEEFQVYVQPKYDPVTGKLRGGEALVRWLSPAEGLIPPGRFIPIFERTGFVTRLDDYMISHMAALQSQWLAAGKEIVPISVNVSRAHFAQPDLAEHIRDLVDAHQVPRQYIEIELTESAFFDDKDALLSTVGRLQEYGFEVSMDDFGSGYSSLNSLKDLPLNVLKLDAEFFRGDDFGTRGQIVVAEAISLAKRLDMKIVAEGVEKKEQVDFLAEQDCDMIQGYYFDKPMPAEEYAQKLEGGDAEPAPDGGEEPTPAGDAGPGGIQR